MKKIINIIIILISFSVNAQYGFYADTTFAPKTIIRSHIFKSSHSPISDGKNYVSIEISPCEGDIEIHGDTLKAIRLLINRIDQLQKESNEKTDCIRRAVDFENTVPDYLTNNKEYRIYLAAIKRQGYTSSVEKIKPVKPAKKRKLIVRDIKIKKA